MPSILQDARKELSKHSLDTFTDKTHQVATPGCPRCKKSFYTVNQLVEHLAEDVLPQILQTALKTTTRIRLLQGLQNRGRVRENGAGNKRSYGLGASPYEMSCERRLRGHRMMDRQQISLRLYSNAVLLVRGFL
jgi:hypothetical protein